MGCTLKYYSQPNTSSGISHFHVQDLPVKQLTVPGQDITLSFLLEIVYHWTERKD
jgi:hypothetical protein